jgi:hypothetical protein
MPLSELSLLVAGSCSQNALEALRGGNGPAGGGFIEGR